MKKVRFLKHWTIKSGSDHETLFVLLAIKDRKGKWQQILVASANMGGHFSEEDLRTIFMHDPHVVCLQEGGDQPWVAVAAKENHYRELKGSATGQPSTPTLVSHQVTIEMKQWVKLLGAVPIGPGAGPDTSKPKWWNKNKLSLNGAKFGASSVHLTVSQQNKKRLAAAMKEMSVVLRAVLAMRRPMLVVGDTNSDYSGALTRWVLKRGMTSNHDELGEIPTMGSRSIDALYVQRRLVKR